MHSNLVLVLDSLPILHTRFMNGIVIHDAEVTVADLASVDDADTRNAIILAPFDLTAGPLCRFGVNKEKNMLLGCIHHSIADGRSMQILLKAIYEGHVESSTKIYNARKYAAYEALPEVQDGYKDSVVTWKEMLGDTAPRLEVDFASSSAQPSASYVLSFLLERDTVNDLQAFCRKQEVSMFVLALGVLHHSLRSYSHCGYAIGTAYDVRPGMFLDAIGMFVNTVLVPFRGGSEGGEETLMQLHSRWTNDILPHASTPYDMIVSMGYGCNIYLAFNVGMHESNTSSTNHMQFENVDAKRKIDAKFDLRVTWSESPKGDGSLEVSFES